MSEDTIFGKIARGEIPANIVYEDDLVLAFRDLYPAAPTHILIIPRKPIPRLCDANVEDKALLGHMLLTANQVSEINSDWLLTTVQMRVNRFFICICTSSVVVH